VGRVSIRVLPDVSDFRKKLKKDLEAATKGLDVNIPVDIDTKAALAKLAALRTAINNIGDANAKIDISGGAGAALEELIKKSERLKNSASGIGKGFRDSEKDVHNFRRVADTALDGLQSAGKGLLATIGGPITILTGGLGDMSRVGLMVVGVLLLIPPILGVIGALIGGLPSLLFAFGAAAGVVMLGLDGIKKAGDAFAKTMEPLRASLGRIFEVGLTTQLNAFAKVLNGPLAQGLINVASGLLAFSDGFFSALTSVQGIQQLNVILQNTRDLFAGLGGFMRSFTSGLLTFAEAGSKAFGQLVAVMQNFADRFNDMAKRVAGNGLLQKSLEGLANVTDALLGLFLQLVEQGMAVMVQIGGPLSDLIRSLGPLFGALLPILGTLFNAVAQVVTVLATALTPVFMQLQPLIGEFARIMVEALVPVIKILTPLIVPLATFFLQLFNALTPLFAVMQPIATLLGGLLTQAITILTPLLEPLSNVIAVLAAVITETLAAATPILQRVAEVLGQTMAANIQTLMENFPQLIQAFSDLLLAVLPILPELAQLIRELLPPLIGLLMDVVAPLLQMAAGITKFLMPAIGGLITTIGDLVHGIVIVIQWLADAGQAVFDWVMGLKNIPQVIGDTGRWLVEAGRNVIRGFLEGMRGEFPSMQNIVRGWFDGFITKIKDGLKINSPSKVFIGIGMSVMEGFGDGIVEGGPMATDAMAEQVNGLMGIGQAVSGKLQTEGTMTVVSDSIGEAVERALSNWTVEFDAQGVARLVNQANNDNKTGR
jgi:phage-related protein